MHDPDEMTDRLRESGPRTRALMSRRDFELGRISGRHRPEEGVGAETMILVVWPSQEGPREFVLYVPEWATGLDFTVQEAKGRFPCYPVPRELDSLSIAASARDEGASLPEFEAALAAEHATPAKGK